VAELLQTGCPFCHATNSVKILKDNAKRDLILNKVDSNFEEPQTTPRSEWNEGTVIVDNQRHFCIRAAPNFSSIFDSIRNIGHCR